ncbi:MAG: hypothetical protein HY327_01635 [Chloroflexi bacterium]|nr:hypothetical protein [Chloroflexota bacterium]
MPQRFPHLGKLSVAILENWAKPVLGEKGIAEIRAPLTEKELGESLGKALEKAEARFVEEHSDKELTRAILDLPLANLPSLQQAARDFYNRPSDTTLEKILRERVAKDFPQILTQRITAAVSAYIVILRQEFANIDANVREKIVAQSTLATETHSKRAADGIQKLVETLTSAGSVLRPGSAPPLPSLIIGREIDLRNLKARLGVATTARTANPIQVLTAIRGWPGVGKTTIAAALAHDRDISQTFPDGVLWTSLGPNPSLLSELATWGRALGTDDLARVATTEEASARLTALLRNKRMLLIVDDVWEPQHAVPFQVGGRDCAMLITTRASGVAQALAPKPDDIYRLPVLSDENALELLRTLAAMVVAQHPQESLELVHELEGLPLALQVAGRLLNVEASYGFGVTDLILELRDGTKVLEARPPADRGDIANETSLTVAALFQKSTDRLEPQIRDCFALLGVFAPKDSSNNNLSSFVI